MYTKGPWHVTKEFRTRKYIYDSGGRLVVEVNDDRDEYLANAHLIAAAPKLYEACVNSEKSLWLQIATMPHCRIRDELIINHEQVGEALAEVEK